MSQSSTGLAHLRLELPGQALPNAVSPYKKPKYDLSLLNVMAAQQAAQKTFIDYLQSKVTDLHSIHCVGEQEDWDTAPPPVVGLSRNESRCPRAVPFPPKPPSAPKDIICKQNGWDTLPPLDAGKPYNRNLPSPQTATVFQERAVPPTVPPRSRPSTLPESFLAVSDKNLFISSLKTHRFCATLLEDRVDNMCLFVEQPKPSFDALNTGGKLDKLGPFASRRWKHMDFIHCIFPSRTGQAYFIRHLACTHYQATFSTFVSAIKNGSHDIPVKFYYPIRDYENNFLVVWNESNTVRSF
jgi:hypothetical protein